MGFFWTDDDTEATRSIVYEWVRMRAFEGNPEGLTEIHLDVCSRLEDLGFSIVLDQNQEAPYRPLISAIRESNSEGRWLGFWGHYDVEPANDEDWSTNPWELVEVDSRWIGRGVGDNLVPLAQRLVVFEKLDRNVNIAYFLQGEEEIGSPFAESRYGSLKIPPIDLWIEETGYFYKDGRQRFMVLNQNEFLDVILGKLQEVLEAEGRGWTVRNRPLNKAFGADRCPCLNHLLGEIPYLAIGPNDDFSTVHGIDESLNPSLLPICAQQLAKIVEVMAE